RGCRRCPRTRSGRVPPCPGRAHRLRGLSSRGRSPASDEVLGSVAEGAAGTRPLDTLLDWLDRLPALLVGAGLVAAALAAYWLPGSERYYNHFVWQAEAFLHGTAVIEWPVNLGGFPRGNDWMQDVYPLSQLTGDPTTPGALLPFPPLPAILLIPFVAVWGLATDIRAVSVVLGAIDVGLAWWALG